MNTGKIFIRFKLNIVSSFSVTRFKRLLFSNDIFAKNRREEKNTFWHSQVVVALYYNEFFHIEVRTKTQEKRGNQHKIVNEQEMHTQNIYMKKKLSTITHSMKKEKKNSKEGNPEVDKKSGLLKYMIKNINIFPLAI